MSWTILKELPEYKDKFRRKFALCKCDCGRERPVALISIRSGVSQSCGCSRKGLLAGNKHPNYKHGHRMNKSQTKEWRAWWHMIARCKYPSVERYSHYGGRGITVCKRWFKFTNFLEDVGYAPSPKHSIDRINNEGNYEPKNVKWSTNSEQILNSSKARYITLDGVTLSIGQWAKKIKVNRQTIQTRIDRLGWSIEKSLTVKP